MVGCANSPRISDTDSGAGDVSAAAPAAVRAYVQQQSERAAAAEARGDWAAAVLGYEIIDLLHPGDRAMQQRQRAARQRQAAGVAHHEANAQAAQQRGDADAAQAAWLRVLALDPGNQAAADALRHIEQVQSHRSASGRFTRVPMPGARRAREGAAASAATPPAAAAGHPRRPAARSTSR